MEKQLLELIESKKESLKVKKEKLESYGLIGENGDGCGQNYGAWESEIQFLQGEIQGLESAHRIMTTKHSEKDLAAELFGDAK